MFQMHSLPRARSAAVALATVAVPLPLHLVGHWHRPNGWRPAAHAEPARTAHRHAKAHRRAKAHRVRLPELSSHTWRLAFPATSSRAQARAASRPHAHAANDPSDTISDFQFTPGSLTIHVGDTVTWTNNGPSEHTATANNHSFDTGLLKKGQSASHTFSQAGTFAYICTIHPFMHGTIVVLAASTSSTTPSHATTSSSNSNTSSNSGSSSSNNSSNTGGTSSDQSSSTSSSTLPVTGLNLIATLFSAGGLIGVGVALRRLSRA